MLGDNLGIHCISSSLLPSIKCVTKTLLHSLLKFNETKKIKRQTIKSVFNIHFVAGLQRADIDGGMNWGIH